MSPTQNDLKTYAELKERVLNKLQEIGICPRCHQRTMAFSMLNGFKTTKFMNCVACAYGLGNDDVLDSKFYYLAMAICEQEGS